MSEKSINFKASTGQEEVHFYPGTKKMYYIVNGKIEMQAEAWGGPRTPQPKQPGEPMAAGPTNPGRFIIDWIGPHATDKWGGSILPWGTRIRRGVLNGIDIEYQKGSGKWLSLEKKCREAGRKIGKTPNMVAEVQNRYEQLYGRKEVPDRWVFNEFGPMAIRYYRDKNNNELRDKSEALEGEMIHTTAENEAEAKRYGATSKRVRMTASHGCIHLRPIDLHALHSRGALRKGMPLIVHQYHERITPPKASQGAEKW